ncbi:non-ribosomal peptide synthetase [Azospirillum sp. ST 5-10]|uniref:non-ribosomal peptide synthetase n=1 Tax=unclassified Azospirillum TaxID=2630922 RepID=UPI003F4A5FEA
MTDHPVADVFALSAQQAFVLARHPASGHPAVAGVVVDLPDGTDPGRVAEAVEALCREHEILRTRYVPLPGLRLPVQSIQDGPACAVRTVAAGAVPEALLAEAAARLDLAAGPLLVADVIPGDGATGCRVLLAGPACSLDARSLAVLAARLRGAPAAADEEALQYADYAAWQAELREGEAGRQGEAFWQDVLARTGEPPRLPFERTPDGTGAGAATRPLGALAERLAAAAAALGAPEDSLLLVLWAAFLARITGAGRLLVGYAVDGRREELRDTVGRFARTLPVAVAPDPAGSLRAAWAAVRDGLEHGLSWQDSLYDPDLLDERGRLRCPFVFGRDAAAAPGTRILADLVHPPRLHLTRGDRDLRLASPDGGVDPAMPAVWLGQFAAFLDGALADLDRPLGAVGLLGAEERRRVLETFNASGPADAGGAVLLHRLFEREAAADPERVAVAAGAVRLSYRELDRRAERVAAALRARGLAPDRPVGVYAGRAVETVVAVFGVLKAGGAYLPLDPTYPDERLAFMLADSGARHVLALDPLPARLADAGAAVLSLAPDSPLWQGAAPDSAPSGAGLGAGPGPGPGTMAYLIYTSGSTGTPKGVMVSHANAVASTAARDAFYAERVRRFLLLSSFSFDSSVAGLFWTLAQGGTLHLPDEQAHRDPAHLAATIVGEEISHYLALPSLHAQVLDQLAGGGATRLACVIVAGEACPEALPARHAAVLPEVALVNEYGPTEGTVWCTGWRAEDAPAGPVPIGRPVPGARVHVLDGALEPVPVGVQGEIHVAGAGVARGYLGRPGLTAERFLPDPHGAAPGARLYRTGDLGRYRPDGVLEFLGRVDQQIKIRGYRVELGEIEAALRGAGGVADAAVIARATPAGTQLVGFVVPEAAEGAAANGVVVAERCRAVLADRLPAYMVPARLHPLDRLPQTPNGKVDRRALEALDTRSRAYVAPRTELERVLAAVWQEALGVERVGVHDNFFELGGHSLLATRLRTRLQAELNVALPLRLFFEGQTLERFAARVEEHRRSGAEPATVDALETLFEDVDAR